jgi:hypothetical protein
VCASISNVFGHHNHQYIYLEAEDLAKNKKIPLVPPIGLS